MTVLAPLLALGLAAAAPDPGVLRVATPGLAAGEGATERQASFFSATLMRVMSEQGAQVAGPGSLERALGAERLAVLRTCTPTDASCMKRSAGGLDVDAVLVGRLERKAGGFTLTLQALSAQDGAALVQRSVDAYGEGALMPLLEKHGAELAAELTRVTRRSLRKQASLRLWAIAPATVGVGLGGIGGTLLLSAAQKHAAVRDGGGTDMSPRQAFQLAATGRRDQVVGGVLTGLGVAALGTAAFLFFQGDAAAVPFVPSVHAVPGGAGVGVGGSLP